VARRLRFMAEEMPRHHGTVSSRIDGEDFESASAARGTHSLPRGPPDHRRHGRIVAMVGDGHTTSRRRATEDRLRAYPVKLSLFKDGL